NLEIQLQAELQLPHIDSAARIVDRAEGARSRYGEAGGCEGVAGQRSIRISKAGMIQDIECLESEIQPFLLGEAEALVERKIEAEDPRACGDVAAQVSVTTQTLHGESL